MNLDLLDNALKAAFPVKAERASLDYVEVIERKPGSYAVVIRLVVWDEHQETGTRSIRDIKEQEVYLKLASLDLATITRVGEFARALARVAAQAIATADVECYMPADFIDFSPLKLAKSHTESDFVAALSVRSRLGKFLAAPEHAS